jgi:hypothetical protein
MSDEGSGQAKGGNNPKDGFNVLSDDKPAKEKPKDGPDSNTSSSYDWDDNLNQDQQSGKAVKGVGQASFQGTVTADQIECDGSITITGGTQWTGTVELKGTLDLVNGKVGDGFLDVKPSNNPPPFSRVRVTKENPKRYKTV